MRQTERKQENQYGTLHLMGLAGIVQERISPPRSVVVPPLPPSPLPPAAGAQRELGVSLSWCPGPVTLVHSLSDIAQGSVPLLGCEKTKPAPGGRGRGASGEEEGEGGFEVKEIGCY